MTRCGLGFVPATLAGMLTVVSPLDAQAPTRLEQIPTYPGAARVPDREAEETSMGAAAYVDRVLRSSAVRVYRVAAALEDVARFYQQRLAAREIQSEEDWERAYPEHVRAGQASPVLCQFEPVDLGPESALENVATVRAAYARKRAPFRPGVWLVGADFRWTHRESATRHTEFNLYLQDTEAFELTTSDYHHETEIVILARTWDAPEAAEEEPEPEPVAAMAAPTEAQLGVPLYPGARFDGDISAQMSEGDDTGIYYVFASADPVTTVAAFYERHTGKKGMETEGGVLIVVQGQGLFPDLGVTVQPNVGTFAGSVRSVITVRRRR